MSDSNTLAHAAEGLQTLASPWSVSETIDRLEAAVRAHGASVFARIDHAAAAGRALAPGARAALADGIGKLVQDTCGGRAEQ
ncbi:MAG TPA: hypothetical protein VK972_07370 [Wenzhouxiangella sp.]|nr:hypothetical protein [Wenzhouxiangella sp.]